MPLHRLAGLALRAALRRSLSAARRARADGVGAVGGGGGARASAVVAALGAGVALGAGAVYARWDADPLIFPDKPDDGGLHEPVDYRDIELEYWKKDPIHKYGHQETWWESKDYEEDSWILTLAFGRLGPDNWFRNLFLELFDKPESLYGLYKDMTTKEPVIVAPRGKGVVGRLRYEVGNEDNYNWSAHHDRAVQNVVDRAKQNPDALSDEHEYPLAMVLDWITFPFDRLFLPHDDWEEHGLIGKGFVAAKQKLFEGGALFNRLLDGLWSYVARPQEEISENLLLWRPDTSEKGLLEHSLDRDKLKTLVLGVEDVFVKTRPYYQDNFYCTKTFIRPGVKELLRDAKELGYEIALWSQEWPKEDVERFEDLATWEDVDMEPKVYDHHQGWAIDRVTGEKYKKRIPGLNLFPKEQVDAAEDFKIGKAWDEINTPPSKEEMAVRNPNPVPLTGDYPGMEADGFASPDAFVNDHPEDRFRLVDHIIADYTSLTRHYGNPVKDLTRLNRDLERVIMVETRRRSWRFQPENAFPVAPFNELVYERSLDRARKFLFGLSKKNEKDFRDAIKLLRQGHSIESYLGEELCKEWDDKMTKERRKRIKIAQSTVQELPFGYETDMHKGLPRVHIKIKPNFNKRKLKTNAGQWALDMKIDKIEQRDEEMKWFMNVKRMTGPQRPDISGRISQPGQYPGYDIDRRYIPKIHDFQKDEGDIRNMRHTLPPLWTERKPSGAPWKERWEDEGTYQAKT